MTTTFALIHGAWHGAWYWEPLAAELERRGHRAVAADLPCDDPAVTTIDNAKQVVEALGDADDVVVVGHSLGGIVAPVVARLRPARRVVLLAALVPRPGRSVAEERRCLGGPATGARMPRMNAAGCQVRRRTRASAADSGAQISPGRPRIWRTLPGWSGSVNEVKASVAGSNRTSVLAPKSDSHTMSRSST